MRTDDDSWDIVSSVGATALGVAALRAGESRRADALFHDPYADLMVSAVGSPAWTRLSRRDIGDIDQDAVRSYGALGDLLVARTCYFDDYLDAAAAAGVRQIVIVAAGLDARAYRLDWPSGTIIFELDQPKVLQFKASALAAQDVGPAVDRRAVAVDLREDWPAALRDKGFDADVPTAWLVEGLLRYLPADAQDRLLTHIAAMSAPGSRVALNTTPGNLTSNMQEQEDNRDRMLAALNIDLDVDSLWYPAEGRTDPVEWFDGQGWMAVRADPAAVLIDRGRDVPDDVAAEMRNHLLMTATRPGGDSTP
ncbi:methyltransferase (TIGR00027 family) [Nocardia tenerifensis]|uniref:S-adenosyl-L-methionine-dependent methyltransferase n=1 Tax=Nocardia tenerifensis TaxID=228006 RepID=A0A318JU70_9NOCA|nr:class I SAM-dependent methyltransferase [Nocardia tenerifensis]PXX56489.1 methyltransferase (TIGR00027 family) [Nocardia tenerifensis]